MDANELIASIEKEKNEAISNGVLREEKKLEPIKPNDVPRILPDGWAWCRLGDYAMKVTDYVASGSFASLKENVLITNDENYAVMVKTADFSNDFTKNLTYTDEKGYHFLENSNLFGGELILSNIGSIGKVFIVPDLKRPMTLASNTVMVRMTHNEYNKYMYYMFKAPFGQGLLKSISSGTSMLKFNKTQLKSTIIPVAPLEVQKKICDVLDRVQRVIDERVLELEKLDELIKARFVELFGNVATEDYKYETRKLGDVAEVGSSHRVFTSEFVEDGIPFYRGTEIGELANGQKPSDPYYISEEHYNRLANDETKPKVGDLLMPSICNKGQVWMVDTEESFYYKDGRVLCISPDREIYNPKYLQYFMREKTQIEYPKMGSGSTFAEFKIFLLKDFDILTPPRDMQDEFTTFVEQVDKSKVVVQEALDEAELLFDSLMQDYFG